MTVNDLINMLQEDIKENPWLKDAIITSVYAPSRWGMDVNVTPDECLLSFMIIATTPDKKLTRYINLKPRAMTN